MSDLRDRLTRALAVSSADSSDFDLTPSLDAHEGMTLRAAGVLVPIIERADGPNVVLTKRSSHLAQHPGQIAFPGGKVDPTDTGPRAAALREAREEIGLPADAAEVLGHLPVHRTGTGFEMTPVLALVSAFDPIPEAGEVDEVFDVPLSVVGDVSRYRVEARYWRGVLRKYYVVPHGPYYIWGATARILLGLADRLRKC